MEIKTDWNAVVAGLTAAIAVLKDPNATILQKFQRILMLLQFAQQISPTGEPRKFASPAMHAALESCDCEDTKALVGAIGDGSFLKKIAALIKEAMPILIQLLPLFMAEAPAIPVPQEEPPSA